MDDGKTSYPVEVAFEDGWVETFDSSEALGKQLNSFYENLNSLDRELYYWSNIDGEVNLVNFEGWLNLRTGRNLDESTRKLSSHINEVENNLIAKAGYDDRGDASTSHFEGYLNASNEFQSASEALQQAEKELTEFETIISDLHAEKAAKEAEGDANAVAKIEAEINNYISERDEVENMISEIQDDSAFEFEAFMPINEVNFEAWKSVNESLLFEEVTSKLNKDLQDEISRAISVEAELDIKVTDIIENTDVSKIDSFVEVINEFNKVSAANFDSIYAKKVAITFDGDDEATLANPVKPESLQVYINGLMVELGGDYTEQVVDGAVSVVQFTGDALDLVQAGAKLGAYGVYGSFSSVGFNGIDYLALIAEKEEAFNAIQDELSQNSSELYSVRTLKDKINYDLYLEEDVKATHEAALAENPDDVEAQNGLAKSESEIASLQEELNTTLKEEAELEEYRYTVLSVESGKLLSERNALYEAAGLPIPSKKK